MNRAQEQELIRVTNIGIYILCLCCVYNYELPTKFF